MWASCSGHLACMQYLILKGEDDELLLDKVTCAAMYECGYYVSVVQYSRTALIWTSMTGHLKCIEYLIGEGANVSSEDEVQLKSDLFQSHIMFDIQNGWTPLICASKEGHLECMEYLISHGANVSQGSEVILNFV